MSKLEEELTLERLNNAINMRLFTSAIPPQFTISVGEHSGYIPPVVSNLKFLQQKVGPIAGWQMSSKLR